MKSATRLTLFSSDPRASRSHVAMEIGGLPLHPLVIHAAVVFGPLGALSALGYAVLARWRDRLRWPMLVLALLATGASWRRS